MKNEHAHIVGRGIGASLTRKEDARFLTGRGQYVGDMRMPDALDVAFVRSPLAHAGIRSIDKPEGCESLVYTMRDMAGVKPILAASGLPGFRRSVQYPLALDKVRHVGELVAMCVAPTRARAEDIADNVFVDYDELAVIADMHAAADGTAPGRIHDDWDGNVFLETHVDKPASLPPDTISVNRKLRTSRQCMLPLEGRGVLCWWDTRMDQLVMVSASQMPHINRTGLAECLGLDEGRIRVVSPDVGGGFGYKGILLPEEICCAWLTMHLKRPIRWLEDRREHLSANANCREHAYDITVHVQSDGRLAGIECDAIVDSGAYSSYPFSACLEAAQIGSILPGPYRMDAYRCRTRSAATNKPPILPYRGVARTGVCFALEVCLDAAARQLGIEPHELRRRSLVQAGDMPYTNITGKLFDSGDYTASMDRAVQALGWTQWRERQAAALAADPAPQRRIGLGLAVFCEQGAHGTSVYHGWGIPMVPGYEQCNVRMTPDGILELQIGVHSHGQSLETTMAQIANTVLGIDPANVRVLHGDTATSPYSTGTWGSRCAVMAGGAVGTACEQLAARIRLLAASLMDVPEAELHFQDGSVVSADGAHSLSLKEIAHTWYRAPQKLPPGVDPAGLGLVAGYRMQPDSGTFSYACHACAVEVDTVTGRVRLLDYAICEDGGVLLNPMVVEGQLLGGLAQGIGTALYEEMPFDTEAQPMASTLADYIVPGAGEMPDVHIEHMQTPSPFSKYGQKGIGEGGAIAPPAAIANAVNDALAGLGAEVCTVPISPERVLHAIRSAQVRT